MTASGAAWILLSAVAHALWNFLFKRAGGTPTFIGLSKIAEAVVLAPVFVWVALPLHVPLGLFCWLSVVGAAFTLASYVFLSAAYAKGDLAFVYPVARGSILCFLPVFGALFLGEHVDRVGATALVFLTLGVLVMQLPTLTIAAARDLVRHLCTPAAALALGTGLAIATSVLWDKQAIQQLPRFTYYYGYTVLVGASYAAYFAMPAGVFSGASSDTLAIWDTWRRHRLAIIVVGLCNTLSYMLILVALKSTTSSYVVGLRQLSIGIGVFFGYYFLREPLSRARVVGVVLLLVGCVLIPLAR